MKKKTRSCLNNLLDHEFSEFIRRRGKCQRCSKTNNLQCAHIYSRRYKSIRWNPLNALCLCASCHFWAHNNPLEFGEFVHDTIGLEYEDLKNSRNNLGKYLISELEEKLAELKRYKP